MAKTPGSSFPGSGIPKAGRRGVYLLEKWMVRGAHFRFLLVAAAVGVLSITGGAAVRLLGTGFDDLPGSFWWAFLRLTDPGYLGEDVGVVNRVVSTFLTMAGYVVFMGALVAIMTQWLQARMARLESGITPLVRERHIVILGWTSRTHAVVRELLISGGRVRRFLRRTGARSLQVAILAEEVSAARLHDLRDAVGDPWDELRVTLRSGSALRPEHLARVDVARAAAIIIPGAEFGGSAKEADTQTIKTLLSLERSEFVGPRPLVVAELFHEPRARVAAGVYRGPCEIVCSGTMVSRLLAQNLRHPGLSGLLAELFSREYGNGIYIRGDHGLSGEPFGTLRDRFSNAIPMGVLREENGQWTPQLNPPADFRIGEGDDLVVLAASYAATRPLETVPGDGSSPTLVDDETAAPPRSTMALERGPPWRGGTGSGSAGGLHRVLILGWSHKIPALLGEIHGSGDLRFQVTVASVLPAEDRRRELMGGPSPDGPEDVRLVDADTTDPAVLAQLGPEDFDTIVVVGSDWTDSEEEADARSLMAMLGLRMILEGVSAPPNVVVELLDPRNAALLGPASAEIIVSPLILSHMMAQLALRPELNQVFNALFRAQGVELAFHPSAELMAAAQLQPTSPGVASFSELAQAAQRAGMTALGVREGVNGTVHLNPPRDVAWTLAEELKVIVLWHSG